MTNKSDLINCFSAITPSAEQKEKMLQRILANSNAAETQSVKRTSRRAFIILAASVLLVLIATTALAITFSWHEKLREFFHNPSSEQMESVNSGVATPEATMTKNGLTINILQTLADSNGCYVLYEVTAPEDIEFNDDLKWSWWVLHVPATPIGYGGGIIQNRVVEQNGNQRTGLMFKQGPSSWETGKARLILRDLGYVKNAGLESMEWVTVLEGEWELEWDFTSYQQSKVIAVNQPIRINGKDKLITEVVISPISVCVYLQGDDKSTDTSINVNFDDGSCITYDPKNPNAFFLVYLMNEDEMIYEHMLYYRFENLIDVGTVENISINNMTIPLL